MVNKNVRNDVLTLFKNNRGKRKDNFQRILRSGFTLVELLVVIGIIAILVTVSFSAFGMASQHAHSSACLAHMRTLGMAFVSYSTDNDGELPGRVTEGGKDRWPVLLLPYVGGDPKVYVDPGDPVANKVPPQNLVSNNGNNSSFFFNGFNDLGFYTNPTLTIRMVDLNDTSNLLLLGQKVHGSDQYYMDFVEGNENDILNKQSYFGGSNYVFADGSARFLYLSQYDNMMWLVNKSYQIPPVPGH
jgi:prepilin-type N-terminal cleavage/methylation domain-containing protein/prepilin-type processing-associated H-X9-DG protein